MCLSYCTRNNWLFWNHDDCSFEFCPVVIETPGACFSCRHRQNDQCGLTRAALPPSGGCCHWNVAPAEGVRQVTLEMLQPLGLEPGQAIGQLLTSLNTVYQVDEQGRIWLDLARLSLPDTFGLGVESGWAEAMDWSDWESAWLENGAAG